MKTIGKLKLTKLSQAQLDKNEQSKLKGGSNCCICSCRYVNYGGASTGGNADGSNSGGILSPGGGYGSGSFA